MATFDLDPHAIESVLSREDVVRVAFREGEDRYLVPLGYVWLHGALHGVSGPGRKIDLARADPRVTFQVDTSARTGWYAWESVTGEGRFEVVVDEDVRRTTLAAWAPAIEAAPVWWRREIGPAVDAGRLLVWRLTPTRTAGRRFGPRVDDGSA
jgi:nitroimidazol reductase NimA-like FMN-containing flavoprotein (pyridoxamine 5'-phosphate oxidase superfamily)